MFHGKSLVFLAFFYSTEKFSPELHSDQREPYLFGKTGRRVYRLKATGFPPLSFQTVRFSFAAHKVQRPTSGKGGRENLTALQSPLPEQ